MNEKLSPPLPGKGGAPSPAENLPAVDNAAAGSPVETVVPAKSSSAPLFGGHKGGGKKRADGLIAGSEAAKAADRESNRIRMQNVRAAQKSAQIPPPLPGVAAKTSDAVAPLAGDFVGVPVPPPGAGDVPVVVPSFAFVAWSTTLLARPVKLATKIIDRIRCAALMTRVKKLKLTSEQEKVAEEKIKFKAEVVNDFNNALANCAAVELNKRRVPGAQHSHWLDVVICGGELVSCHLDTVDWLEKTIAENRQAAGGNDAAAKN